jgi:hypothetical protein
MPVVPALGPVNKSMPSPQFPKKLFLHYYMIDKLNEIGGCYGMEMNVEKTKIMRISRQHIPVKIMIDQKQLQNVDFLKVFG